MTAASHRSRGRRRGDTRTVSPDMNVLAMERLERREVLTLADLQDASTLADLYENTADIYPGGLTLDNRQQVVHPANNFGGEIDLYSFTPAWSGAYRFTAASSRSTMDPVIAVYDGDGVRIAFNDDATTRTRNSLATASLNAGTTYTFAVTSFSTQTVGRYTAGITGLLQDDAYENNDTLARARVIQGTSAVVVTGVMADAHDYYRFTLPVAAAAGSSITLGFAGSQGDLDLKLLNSRGAVLRSSAGEGNQETIDISGLVAGTYSIDVYGYGGAFNPSYQLTLNPQSGGGPPAPTGDALESNNTLPTAKDLGTIAQNSSWQNLSITAGDVDFYKFTLASPGNASSELLIDFRQSQGDIDAELLRTDGTRIAISQSTSDQERFSLDGLAAGTYVVRVYGYNSVANPAYGLAINHSAIGPPPDPPPVDATGSWTVMVYMTATDLATFGFADVNEMEDALTRVAPGVRFTLFWDQWNQRPYASGNGSQSAWGTAGRAVVQADSNMSTVATTFDIIGERNTGDPATLRDFITWSQTNAPAENYALVMWNHGGGLTGVNFDDESGGDSITVGDLRSAIVQAAVPIDVLAYDACLMGMAEQAYEARGLATVLIASEEVIDGPGFNYSTVFQALNSNPASVTPQSLAQGMVASFTTSYVADGSSTFSALTAGAMEGVASSLRTFTDAAVGLSAANVTAIKGILANVTRFTFPEYIDLKQFMQRISTTATLPLAVRNAATGVVATINEAVFVKMADARQTGGLAVYLPSTAAQESSSYGLFSGFESATRWGSFVNRVLGRATGTRLGAGTGLSGGSATRGAPTRAAWAAAIASGEIDVPKVPVAWDAFHVAIDAAAFGKFGATSAPRRIPRA